MKIAVLLPSSTTHKQISYDFYQSMQLVVERGEHKVEWMSASIGFGINEEDILTKAEDMLLNKRADILIVFADCSKVKAIFPVLEATNREMLLVNMGAKFHEDWTTHPKVVHLNLQEALLARLTGLTRQPGSQGIFFSNQYDGGYAMGQMLVDAFIEKQGEIVFNFVPKAVSISELSIEPLLQFVRLRDDICDLLLVNSNPVTATFWKQWTSSPDKQCKMYANSTFLMESLAEHEDALLTQEISGHFAWLRNLEVPENIDFVKHFETEMKREATFFGALGWDTGLILRRIMISQSAEEPVSMVQVLGRKNEPIDLTRGSAQWDAESNMIVTDAYFLDIKKGEMKISRVVVENILDSWHELRRIYPIPNTTGWFNTYLCS